MSISKFENSQSMTIHDLKYSNEIVDITQMNNDNEIRKNLYENAIKYLYDLIACHQVRELSSSNVSNYFAGINIKQIPGGLITRSLNYLSSKIPSG